MSTRSQHTEGVVGNIRKKAVLFTEIDKICHLNGTPFNLDFFNIEFINSLKNYATIM